VKRRAATFDPTRCRELSRPAPSEDGSRLEKLDRSPVRSPLRRSRATHSVELLGGVATSSLFALRIVCQLAPHLEVRMTKLTRRRAPSTQSLAKS
jgi:hypothetical protein